MDDLQKLLQVKRHETPGEEYFDHFVAEFHRYQRAPLIKEQTGWEKFCDEFQNLMAFAPRPAFAFSGGLAACLLVLGLALGGFHTPVSQQAPAFAAVEAPAMPEVHHVAGTVEDLYSDPYAVQPEVIPVGGEVGLVEYVPEYVTGEVSSASYDTAMAF